MVVMNIVRNLRQQMQTHIDLIPLMGAYVGAGLLSVSIMVYTSVRKEDVMWNRWGNPMPAMHLDPTKNQQRLRISSDDEKKQYFRDEPLEDLRKEIYDHHNWFKRSSDH